MQKPTTIAEYLDGLDAERRAAIQALGECIRENLPEGFEEILNYGMPSWVVPHSLYPSGYHSDPKLPLPFIAIASQRNHIAVYHMGIYAHPSLLEWFKAEFPKNSS